jgi:hypothetical protein
MNIFFGKISQKIDVEQLTEGYYSSDRNSTWFGELQLGDYVYVIGGDKIQFWKAREWGVKNGRESLLFDVLNPDLGINVSQLIALKFLKLTTSLAVLTSRSARNKAFFKLETIKDFSVTDLSNAQYYKNLELYRTIKIIEQADIIESSEDIQLIYKDNKLQLVDTDFIESSIKNDFVDNLDKKGKGAKMKDNVLEFFSNTIKNLPATITYKQIGIRSFYDTFFCEYIGKDKYFLVGAFWDTSNPQDQTERFVREGIWFNGYEDKFLDEVNAVPVGSNIAIKAAFVREKSKSVMTIKARGIVTENLQDGQTLKVDWEDDFVPFEVNFGGYMRTIKEVIKSEHIKSIWSPEDSAEVITSTDKNSQKTVNDMRNFPLNQILYGPPGTGKTYNSINKAISIINPKFDLTQDRSIVKKEYDRLVTENQILFTTFHQSMSYEDFIEGIKPETKKENVIYDVVPGLFLEICNTAENNWEDAKEGNSKKLSFEDAFLLLKEEWDENEEIKFPLKTKGNDYTIIGFTKKSIQFKKASGGTGHTLSIATLKDYYYKKKEVRLTGVGIYYPSILDKLNKYQPTTISKKVVKNYVLIIDEINRGNVSQIFGELITLIEEDKRLGENEALEVMLPYSKEKFGVPPNLYIVGTMNTADRSVEALDTALRRRFSFEEMPPRAKVVEEKKFSDYPRVAIMEKINNRIEVLLDRNHTLGHAYFIKNNFKCSFENEIIPLLQEYFYNDYGKIGLVFGKGFVREKAITAKNDKSIFADFDTKNDVDINKSYELIPFTVVDFDTAIQTLLV